MWSGRHALGSLATVVILYCAAILASRYGLFSNALDLAAGANVDTNARIGFRDFWTVNIALLSIQGALIGLVFPLVIAFVGLLNQGRAAFSSRLTIYIEATAAVFVGVSSLLLCVALAVQLPFAAQLETSGGAVVTAFNLIWLIVNVAALAYFVLRTIAFLHPARRAPLIRAYIANVTWPAELNRIITRNRWAGAIEYGYLPDGDDIDMFNEGRKARVWYSSLWDAGEPRVKRRLRKPMRLIDMRLAMLAPIVSDWLKQARAGEGQGTQDFSIPLEPGRDYEGEPVLVRATLPIIPISRFGIWAAIRFRAVADDPGAVQHSAKLLRELIADLIALIDGRQADEFAAQLSEVIEFHAFLYRLAQLSDEDFNYAQLGADWGMFGFGRTLGEGWTAAYRDVIRRAVERLPEETDFMGRIAYLSAHIYGLVGREVSPKGLTPLIGLSNHLSFRLMEWAADEHRSESAAAAEVGRTFTLTRRSEIYAKAWREFVGGWERLLTTIVTVPDRKERKERSWVDLKRIAPNVIEHLSTTTHMAGRAIWSGDLIATNWTCDLLLHWEGQSERGLDTGGNAYYLLRKESLTLETLACDWAAFEALALMPDYANLDAPVVFRAIVHNVWRDHVVVLASVSLHWAMQGEPQETALRAARMLLRNEPHDRGDTGPGHDGALSGVDILVAALRIESGGDRYGEGSYAGTFEQLTANLGRLGESEMVSLRTYSSGGGPFFGALHGAVGLGIMALAPGAQAINGELRRQLTQADDEVLRQRQDYLGVLLEAFEGLTLAQHGAVLQAITGDADPAAFEVRRQNARRLVEQALDVLTGHRTQAIVDAQVSQARLDAVAVTASADAFTPGTFPLNLFGEILATPEELQPFTLRVNQVSKGAYTEPPMAQAVVNEDSWWRDSMRQQVAAVIWAVVRRDAILQSVDGRTPDEFWAAVRDGAARLRQAGHDPVLVIGNAMDPPWLFEWRWRDQEGAPKPADLVITREADQADGYEFSMNDIKVYRAQTAFGEACLIPTQLFQRLRYHDFGDGIGVEVRFQSEPDNPWRGTLSATFQHEVALNEMEAFAIRFAPEPPAKDNEQRAQPAQGQAPTNPPADGKDSRTAVELAGPGLRRRRRAPRRKSGSDGKP